MGGIRVGAGGRGVAVWVDVGGSGVAVAVEVGVADGVAVAEGVFVGARVGMRVAVSVAVGGSVVAVAGTPAGAGVGVDPQPARTIASAAARRNFATLRASVAEDEVTRLEKRMSTTTAAW